MAASLIGFLLALFAILVVAASLYPAPIYVGGWTVVGPLNRIPIAVNSPAIQDGSGFTMATGRLHVEAHALRRRDFRITNKRMLRFGGLIVLQQ